MKQKKNTSPARRPRIKKGDMVILMAGADKRKRSMVEEQQGEGEVEMREERGELNRVPRRVLAVYPKTNQILVEGVNVAKRSYKKGMHKDFPEGGIHDKEMPIHISNVMLSDPKNGKDRPWSRVGVRIEKGTDGRVKRTRYAKASGTDIKN